MPGAFFLAVKYLTFHRLKALVMVGCVSLTIYLPVAMHFLIGGLEKSLTARADSSPLIVGAKGSRIDLALCGLYFSHRAPEMITMSDVDEVNEADGTRVIPIHVGFRAGQAPVVGTTDFYFTYRGLQLAAGTDWQRLGDCVLGAEVARRLNLQVSDKLQTDPDNLFDLAGQFPLRMRVTGVLAATGGPDDRAVFVSLQTAWIIAGIGHGHDNQAAKHKTASGPGIANAGVKTYTEITDENVKRFHFHGDEGEFPVSAILAIAESDRAATILLGQYLQADATLQVVQPTVVVGELLQTVFRVRAILDVAAVLMAVVTISLLSLVMMLSLKARQAELETMFRLGCSRSLVSTIVVAELAIVLAISLFVALALVAVTVMLSATHVENFLVP